MITKATSNNHILVQGRAGELAHRTNTLTFSLIRRIFGQNGPYRNTLKKFGVEVNDVAQDYVLFEDGIVYTDITLEQHILWGKYPLELYVDSNEVKYKVLFVPFQPFKYIQLLRKIITDAGILNDITFQLELCKQIYKEISDKYVEALAEKSVSFDTFMQIYEKTVYIDYLYELLREYNNKKYIARAKCDTLPEAKRYIQANDYMISEADYYREKLVRLDKGFRLDDYDNLELIINKAAGKEFIPSEIINFEVSDNLCPKRLQIEKTLQCLKNNTRIKIDSILLLLNNWLIYKAHEKGIMRISDKTVDEIIG